MSYEVVRASNLLVCKAYFWSEKEKTTCPETQGNIEIGNYIDGPDENGQYLTETDFCVQINSIIAINKSS